MESCWDHVGRLMIFVGAIVVALRIVLWKHSRNRRAAKIFLNTSKGSIYSTHFKSNIYGAVALFMNHRRRFWSGRG